METKKTVEVKTTPTDDSSSKFLLGMITGIAMGYMLFTNPN
jgi:hypothetical protein